MFIFASGPDPAVLRDYPCGTRNQTQIIHIQGKSFFLTVLSLWALYFRNGGAEPTCKMQRGHPKFQLFGVCRTQDAMDLFESLERKKWSCSIRATQGEVLCQVGVGVGSDSESRWPSLLSFASVKGGSTYSP